jgi:hypothetical protein
LCQRRAWGCCLQGRTPSHPAVERPCFRPIWTPTFVHSAPPL